MVVEVQWHYYPQTLLLMKTSELSWYNWMMMLLEGLLCARHGANALVIGLLVEPKE